MAKLISLDRHSRQEIADELKRVVENLRDYKDWQSADGIAAAQSADHFAKTAESAARRLLKWIPVPDADTRYVVATGHTRGDHARLARLGQFGEVVLYTRYDSEYANLLVSLNEILRLFLERRSQESGVSDRMLIGPLLSPCEVLQRNFARPHTVRRGKRINKNALFHIVVDKGKSLPKMESFVAATIGPIDQYKGLPWYQVTVSEIFESGIELYSHREGEPSNVVGARPNSRATPVIEDVSDVDPIEELLGNQPLSIYRFLKNRSYSTSYDTLREQSSFWRNGPPDDTTILRALRRLRDELNQITGAPRLVIEHQTRRVRLNKTRPK